ncbi:DUF402 domain-containing protein [Nocardioides acrostichi]|uniref:DUF402 domain-containing protein n=1 Tax=Nocardioides acrostichi TaxID=2784339 RepID=A0A930UU27_9ACTN|nr:DUF402 domain-containing protein [Nocardioides acrostichi]MBF4160196.1 DUF402 domain-containing protein [Nocardioides acrostichi]
MTPGRIVMTKWGNRAHWEFAAIWLGEDEHGHWLGVPAGTRHSRPGMEFVSDVPTVTLAPRKGWYLPTWHAPDHWWCDTYVDIATPPALAWVGEHDDTWVLRSTDLDLDVVRERTGRLFVDDEDEFEEHRLALGYPDDVVTQARAECAAVHAAMQARRTPFDGSHRRWLDLVPQ